MSIFFFFFFFFFFIIIIIIIIFTISTSLDAVAMAIVKRNADPRASDRAASSSGEDSSGQRAPAKSNTNTNTNSNSNAISNAGPPQCEWTEAAAAALLGRYSEKFASGRGYLRVTDWQEVVDCVNSQIRHRRGYKTLKQCRDKVDSLKRRYKMEKKKAAELGLSAVTWPYFRQLDRMMRFPTSSPPPPPPAFLTNSPVVLLRAGPNRLIDEQSNSDKLSHRTGSSSENNDYTDYRYTSTTTTTTTTTAPFRYNSGEPIRSKRKLPLVSQLHARPIHFIDERSNSDKPSSNRGAGSSSENNDYADYRYAIPPPPAFRHHNEPVRSKRKLPNTPLYTDYEDESTSSDNSGENNDDDGYSTPSCSDRIGMPSTVPSRDLHGNISSAKQIGFQTQTPAALKNRLHASDDSAEKGEFVDLLDRIESAKAGILCRMKLEMARIENRRRKLRNSSSISSESD